VVCDWEFADCWIKVSVRVRVGVRVSGWLLLLVLASPIISASLNSSPLQTGGREQYVRVAD